MIGKDTDWTGLELETERLTLRELGSADFEAVHAYGSDPEVVEYVPWGPNTEQDTRDFIEHTYDGARADPRLNHVLAAVARNTGQLVGTVGLYSGAADPGQAMLGYAYGRAAWGRGYATEAALAMVEFGFLVLGLRRIWAACDPDNHASIHVLEKVGMRREGRLRDDTVIRGRVRDTLMWGILHDEWQTSSNEQTNLNERSGS